MTIDKLINVLEALKKEHGNIDVTVWQYGGGLDDLCDVMPVFDAEYGLVVLDAIRRDPEIRR
jgi:hypothetical protein